MRWIRWYCTLGTLVLLGLALPVQAQPSSDKALSLDDIIEIALSRNPGLNSARRRVQVSDFGKAISRGKHFGRVEIFAEDLYAGFDDANERRLIRRAFLFSSRVRDDIFGANTITTGISYRIPVYTGGRLSAQVEASTLAALASRHQLQQTGDDLILNLSSVFYTLLRLAEDIKVTEASLKALGESKRVIDEAVKVGRRPKVDLFKVNTRVAAVRLALIRRRNTESVTRGALAALMGLDDVTQKLRLAGPLRYTPELIDLDASIKKSLERRPAYQAAKREVAIAERQIRVAHSRRLPQVSMGLVFQGATNDEDMTRIEDDFTASLRVSLPLFTGGVLTGQVGRAKARLARAREKLRELRLSVAREVQGAFFRVKNAKEQIVVARASLQEASEALRIEQLKVRVGRGTIEDLLIAQNAELEAKTNHFSALADANTSTIALRKAVGVIRPINSQGQK